VATTTQLEWEPSARRSAVEPADLLIAEIERAGCRSEVTSLGRRLPEEIKLHLRAGIDPLGHAIASRVIDSLTNRLIEFAVEELGSPPVPWAWLALGSAARSEQGLVTDQDHALAFDSRGEDGRDLETYFGPLASSVTNGLEASGVPRCNADVVSANNALRRPTEHWVDAFTRWMADPRIESTRQATILFDHRRVAGTLAIERVLRAAILSSPDRRRFIERLGAMVTDALPSGPTVRFRKWDVKRDVLMPIVSLARIASVATDMASVGTLSRLRDAVDAGVIDGESADGLAAAFRTAWHMRMYAHVRGAVPDTRGRLVLRSASQRQWSMEAVEVITAAHRVVLEGARRVMM
jgi:CBS domain-containing protein